MTTTNDDRRTLVCVGDVHGARTRLDAVVRWVSDEPGLCPDLVLLTGDFARRPGARRPGQRGLDEAIRTLEPLAAPAIYVPGNHDDPALESEADRARCADRRLIRAAGLRVWGLGGAPTAAGLPYEWSDAEMVGLDPPDHEIFLTHAPPAGTSLDTLADGTHVGSRIVRRNAEEHPSLVVCGHIHEAAGIQRLGPSVCYNAGSLGPPRGRTQVGVIQLDPVGGACRVQHQCLDDGPPETLEARIEWN